MKLIDEWRQAWRFWSVRLQAAGLALASLFAWWPDAALVLWNSMPAEVKALLPEAAVKTLPLFVFGAALIARLVKQEGASNGK